MSAHGLRRWSASIAFGTLLAFWNALLQTSFAHAQHSDSAEQVAAEQPASNDSASGVYTKPALETLGQHLQATGAQAAPSATGDAPPAALSDVERELAALPSGGGEISAQAAALPSGAATQLGMGESFSMQLSSGTAAYSVPIALPAARGRVQPRLDLSYSAAGGFGLAGVGWSIGASAITRQSDRGSPGYDDRASWHAEQDRFVFGGSELVPICTVQSGGACAGVSGGEQMPVWAPGWQYFRSRVESGYLRFFWSPDHRTWRVQGKDGTNLELGVPLDGTGYTGGLENDPDRPKQILRWHLARQYDSQGNVNVASPAPVNVVVYRHLRDGNAVYLSDIFDTSPAATPGSSNHALYAHHTRLVYETRPDPAISYRAGWLTEHALRLLRVDVTSKPFAGGTAQARELVRRYHLGYEPGSHRSLLTSVQLEGRCLTPMLENAQQALPLTSCERLPALRFEYQRIDGDTEPLRDAQGFAFDAFDTTVHTPASSPPHSLDEALTELADVNADGLPDVLVTAAGLFRGKHGVYFNGLDAQGMPGFAAASGMAVQPAADVVDADVLALDSPVVTALDLDADGIVNLVHMPQARRYSLFTPQATAPGASTYEWVGREVQTASEQDVKIDFTQNARNTRVMDVNGDGLVDIVYSSGTELQTFFALGRYPGGDGQFGDARWTGAESAEIGNDPVVHCLPWSSTPVRFSDPDTQLADMNGDGLVDIVRVRSGQLLYWPGRGNGFWGTGARDGCVAPGFAESSHVAMYGAPDFGTAQPGTLLFNDVNGDGLADLVEVRNQDVDIYLNDNAVGFTGRTVLDHVPFRPSSSNYVRLSDVDGSGTPDILWGRAREYQYIDLTGGQTPHLLVKVRNGLGKTAELEYASTAELMLRAQAAGQPWATRTPTTMPALVRSVVRDHLELFGMPAGVHVTEYSYRDPVYDGRQRAFRGFREATVRNVGDGNSPTSLQRTVFHLGECPSDDFADGVDVCSPSERWRDNWHEALAGLPAVDETLDATGVYLKTEHTNYHLRQLYTGLDGRRVVSAVPATRTAFLYDTASFDRAAGTVTLSDVSEFLADTVRSKSRPVAVRASAGTARVRTETMHDQFGNVTDTIKSGCISGCPTVGAGAGASSTDEVLTAHSDFVLHPSDGSRWLFREQRSYVSGSRTPGRWHERVHTYNAAGDLEESYAVLSGTLPLDRSHAVAGRAIAPAPVAQSGGVSAPVQLLAIDHSYDAFGHVTFSRSANGRCRATDYDTDYAQLSTAGRVMGGVLNTTTQCGSLTFQHRVTYDRGLEAVVESIDQRGQPSRSAYDGFGRVTSVFGTDPDNPGQLAALPMATFAYLLATTPDVAPLSIVASRTQDGASPNVDSYQESWDFIDGMGRLAVSLSQADPGAGDGGAWIASGAAAHDAKGGAARIHDPRFLNSPSELSFPQLFTTPYTSREYDAFGRPLRGYGYDRGIEALVAHHALSSDAYDAADVLATTHQNTYATSVADGHGRTVRRIERIKVGTQIEQRVAENHLLPGGEVARMVQRRTSSTGMTIGSEVVRWMRYDSLGRMVLNAEPNTSVGFNPDPAVLPTRALRYAYNDSGDLVGHSDARGCGANYHYDAGGRLLAEDRSPCLAEHALYSAANLSTGDGTEAFYRYDAADPDNASIVDAGGESLNVNASLLHGRLASISALGGKRVYRYDASGRSTGTAVRVQRPGVPAAALASRYATRWYVKTLTLDARGRTQTERTGVKVPQLLGSDGTSELRFLYSKRGLLRLVSSSYGALFIGQNREADGRIMRFALGGVSGIRRDYTYDPFKRRLQDVTTYRGNVPLWSNPPAGYVPPGPSDDPTKQLLLEDTTFGYDAVGNITLVEDARLPGDWPASAKPTTRTFEYDDLYRLTRAGYQHASAVDSWKSPFEYERTHPAAVQPNPHVSFTTRVTEQRFQYDWLGNVAQSTDDQSGFWDRSSGDRAHGLATSGPHQLRSASNRSLAPTSTRKGDLSVQYDAAGNVSGLIVRRDGGCVPTTASCWQRFAYEWDELGSLARARRFDLAAGTERSNHGQLTQALPARSADVDLSYGYDADGQRTLKTATDRLGVQKNTLYIFGTFELRSADWSAATLDYGIAPEKVSMRLQAGPATARVLYALEDMPSLTSGRQHVFLELGDHLGSTSFVVDHATGELVEFATYQAYGATDSDYRPGRWQGFREPYKFTGKEEDIEVGLAYFGARYYSAHLGVWMSPDPAAIHDLGSDPNPYAYVHGTPIMAVDPDGRLAFLAVVAIIAIAAAVSAGGNVAMQAQAVGWNNINWGIKGVAGAAIVGAVAGSVSFGVGSAIGGIGGAVAAGAAGNAAAYSSSAVVMGTEFTVGGLALTSSVGAVSGIAGAIGSLPGGAIGLLGGTAMSTTVGYLGGVAAGGEASWQSFGLSLGVGFAGTAATVGAVEAAEAISRPQTPRIRAAGGMEAPSIDAPVPEQTPAPTHSAVDGSSEIVFGVEKVTGDPPKKGTTPPRPPPKPSGPTGVPAPPTPQDQYRDSVEPALKESGDRKRKVRSEHEYEDARKEPNYSKEAEWEAAGAFGGEVGKAVKSMFDCTKGPWSCAKSLWKQIQKAGPAYEPRIPDH